MSYQFIHVETYSRKGNKEGKTASDIGKEVDREPSHSLHVEKPLPPQIAHNPKNYKNVQELVSRAESIAEQSTNKNGGKVRKDAAIIGAGVVSHPFKMSEVWNDKNKQQEVTDWLKDTLDFLKEEYGDRLEMAVIHMDEEHPHLHFYVGPKEPLNGVYSDEGLHMGKDAQKEARASKKPLSEQRKAYSDAMRDFQDRYFEKVAVKHGMLRLGPKKQRKTRAEHMADKAQAQAIKKGFKKLEENKAAFEGEKKNSLADIANQEAAMLQHIEAKKAEANEAHNERKKELDAKEKNLTKVAEKQAKRKDLLSSEKKKIAKAKAIMRKREAAHARAREELEKPAAKVAAVFSGFGKGKEKIKAEVRAEVQPEIDKAKQQAEAAKTAKSDTYKVNKELRTDLQTKQGTIQGLTQDNQALKSRSKKQQGQIERLMQQLADHKVPLPQGMTMEDAVKAEANKPRPTP